MANKIYTAPETPIVFQDSGGVTLTMQNVAQGIGRVSAQHDRGTGAIATQYLLRATFQKGVAGVVGQNIPVYIFTSDGTNIDGNVGTVDAALTAAQIVNAWWSLPVLVETTGTNVPFTRSGLVWIPTRYVSVGYINSATGALRNTANSSVITLTPVPDEIQ